jgi:uncharacterized LabA/DUF88 family protein
MEGEKKPNYAFIDGQNLYLGSKNAGIDLNYRKFRVYLRDKYNVERAYLFIGYLQKNRNLYDMLQDCGYLLKFKPVLPAGDGQRQKGDVDADLAFNMMRYYQEYRQAVLVTSDGDFDTVTSFLREQDKLRAVISPSRRKCSVLLQQAGGDKMFYLEDIGEKVIGEDEIEEDLAELD